MEIIDVVRKLVGPVQPIGETNQDELRFQNLEVMTDLIDELINDVSGVAVHSNRPEASMRRAGQHAAEYIESVGVLEY